MKRDFEAIRAIEEEKGIISLPTILKQKQYLYRKVYREIPEKIFILDVPGCKDNSIKVKFITKEDFDWIVIRKNAKKPTRGYKGRPFLFCKNCDKKDCCTLDTPCEERVEYSKKIHEKSLHKGDSRFWKSGNPKKSLILCESSRYILHNKSTKGECQKEKCSFYENGNCILSLYK